MTDILFRPKTEATVGDRWLFYVHDRVVSGLVFRVDTSPGTDWRIHLVLEGSEVPRIYTVNPKTAFTEMMGYSYSWF